MGLLDKLFGTEEKVVVITPEEVKLARHIEAQAVGVQQIEREEFVPGYSLPGYHNIYFRLSDTIRIQVRILKDGRTYVFGTVSSPTDPTCKAHVRREAFSPVYVEQVGYIARNREALRAAVVVDEMAL